MPHQHLCLHRLHRLKGNAHNDDDGGAADGQVLDAFHHVARDNGQQGDDAEVNGTEHDDLVDDLLDEVGGGLAGKPPLDFRLLEISTVSY